MDPLWSETCWSTFKYFIILIVNILCIVHWLDNKVFNYHWSTAQTWRLLWQKSVGVLLLNVCCRSGMVQHYNLRLANEPDSSFVLTSRSECSHCCTAVQPHKRVSGGFIFRSHQSDNRRFRSKILLVGCPPRVSVICPGCKANAKHRPPPFPLFKGLDPTWLPEERLQAPGSI